MRVFTLIFFSLLFFLIRLKDEEQEKEKRVVDTKSNVFSDEQIKKFSDDYRCSRKKKSK
jgi:hypothetical protein